MTGSITPRRNPPGKRGRGHERAAPARQRHGVVAPVINSVNGPIRGTLLVIAWWALCAVVVYFIGVSAGWW